MFKKYRHLWKMMEVNNNGVITRKPLERTFHENIFKNLTKETYKGEVYENGGWVAIAGEEQIAAQKAAAANLKEAAAANLKEAAAANLKEAAAEVIKKVEDYFETNAAELDETITVEDLNNYAEAKGFETSRMPRPQKFLTLKDQYEKNKA